MKTQTRIGTVALILALLAGLAPRAGAAGYQMPITFGGYTNRSETLTNFPVLVVFSNGVGSSGFSFASMPFASTNGYDLRFRDASGASLNYEIESWNTNSACYVWVQVPTIATNGSTSITATWGDASRSYQMPYTTNGAVWANGYQAVWHLKDGTTLGTVRDSTTNGYTASINGGVTAVTGKVDGAADFDGAVGSYLSTTFNPQATLGNNLTIRALVYPRATGNYKGVAGDHNSFKGLIFLQYEVSSWNCSAGLGTGWANGSTLSLALNAWNDVSAVYQNSGGNEIITAYKDGVAQTAGSAAGSISHLTTFNIGRAYNANDRYFNGIVDELRVSRVARSADWVWVEYANMVSNTLFGTYGAAGAASSLTYQLPIAFTNYTRAETLSNFPVLVVLTNGLGGLFNYDQFTAPANGGDLRFTDSTGSTLLDFEFEKWNNTGASYVWVRVPQLSSNTTIYAKWGGSDTNLPASTTNGAVWDANYKMVWHLSEGVGATPYDATTNRLAGTVAGGVTQNSAGQVAAGCAFNGASGTKITASGTGLPSGSSARSMSTWIKLASAGQNSKELGGWGANNTDQRFAWWLTTSTLGIEDCGYNYSFSWSQDTQWHHVSVTLPNGGTLDQCSFAFDGVPMTASGTSRTLNTSAANFRMCGLPTVDGYEFSGNVDEWRISNIARSTNWVWAEYANMASNAFFNGYGTVQATAASGLISLQPVANLTTNSVQLIATLIGSSADLYAFWDTQDRGMNFTWAYTNSPLTAFTNTAAGATITNTATGLAPLTQYAYRFYGTNTASGWSGWSAAGSFSTPGPPTVTNTNGVTGLGLGTATLNGVVTATNGAVCYGKIFWGPTDGSNNATAWAYTNDIPGTVGVGTAFSVTLSNLFYGVQYYCRAAASNSYGLGWATNSLGFTTTVPIAGPAGTAGTASYTTANSYTFAAAANNLIAGMLPSATNNTGQPHAGGNLNAGLLTDGAIPGWTMGNTYTIGNNSAITYTLGSAALGYTVSNVNIYAIWGDSGRENITVSLSYSTYNDPNTFTTIPGTSVNYEGGTGSAVARYSATGSGLAVGVQKIRFDFGAQENSYVGYGELEVLGAATPAALAVGITNTPVSSVTSTSAVMNATLSATGSVFSVYGYYWTNGAVSSNVVSVGVYTNAVSTNLNAILSGLLPGTGYAYTFLATNMVTNFWAAPAATFTTAVATVTLTATTTSAYESAVAPTAGVFTVSRGGVTNGALNVYYSIGGTATPGAGVGGDFTNNPPADYVNKTGVVTIANGVNSATVSIWPVNDSTPEPPESVILTLLTNASYIVGSPSNDMVTIYDDDAGNAAPVVTIPGGDQYLLSNSLPIVATLTGNVVDDGKPNPPGVVSQLWTKVSGPGTVTFGNATSITTTASFSAEGVYVLQLWADDSALQASNTVTVSAYLRQVSVQATDALGRTNASDNAAFTVYRPVTCTNETLAIYYTLGGTAVPTTDYSIAPVSGAVSLSPGQTNAVITVTPVYKQAIQQTVILNLTPGLYALGAQGSATCTLAQVTGPDRYWVAASAGNWSDTNNWSFGSGGPGGSSVPGSGSVAVFDGSGNGNCLLAAVANVAGVLITNGYAGTITQNASITVGASGWAQASGSFAGGSQAIAMNGPFTLSGGTFTGTSGAMTMKGNWTHTAGTFSHNNGTVTFDGNSSTYSIVVPSTETFYNLTATCAASITLNLNGNTLVVEGTFTDNAGANFSNPVILNNGTIEARGNVVATTSVNGLDWRDRSGGTATLVMKGTADQSLTSSLGHLCNLAVDKPSGTVTCSGELIIGSFTLTSGTFTSTPGKMWVKGNWGHTAGTFNHNNGTVEFFCWSRSASPYSVSVPATESFYNLSVSSYENLALDLNGNTLVVLGTCANNGGVNGSNPDKFDNGTLELRGNIVIAANTAAGTAKVSLTGAGNQTYTYSSGGVPPGGTWTIDKSGGALTLLTDLGLTASGQQLVWTNGAVDLSSNTLTVAGAVTIPPGTATLGVTVADATKAGRLTCNSAVSGVANAALAITVAGTEAQVNGPTYTILSNTSVLGATFKSVTWLGGWSGVVAYTANGGKNVTLSSLSMTRGTVFRFR